ncbi:zinc-binding dehydrogenase [Novosphingobium profundi]|uniref:zinc-binding dehydrogenase n=1 Tax=Novosphingobium profundi TaxID=1774954 RepID=UPI001CFDA304|nr:zinc-binding dehydrogenase [Novosphingobium profundi]
MKLPSPRERGAIFARLRAARKVEGHAKARELGITVSSTQVRSDGAQLARAAELLARGDVKVVLDSRYPLVDTARAHERALMGGIQGKLVLTTT